MTDPRSEPVDEATGPRCPWCSAELAGDPVNCPSCGATLREDSSAEIPGVTQLDPAAVEAARPDRGRGLLGWLSGEYETEESTDERSSVGPPTAAVRAEMARLEMEAIQAEIDAAAAQEAAQLAEEQAAEAEGPPPADTAPTQPDVPAS
jgi:hypothetical protein